MQELRPFKFHETIFNSNPLLIMVWQKPSTSKVLGFSSCLQIQRKTAPALKKPIIYLPQHFLYFLPLPQGHGSFLPIFGFFSPTGFAGAALASSCKRLRRSCSLGRSASMIPRRSSSAFILPSASAFLIFGPKDSVWGICSSRGKRSKSSLGV